MIAVILLPEAEADLYDAAAFLEKRVPGLGQQLAAEVAHALERLAERPYIGPPFAPGVRRLGVRRFPYDLVYRVRTDNVLIVAVGHQRRKPDWWSERV